jgi:hypothetical protein
MQKKRQGKKSSEFVLPKMTTLALQGKQSVRASFKLSEACIRIINIVAKQLGIKQKSLFDHLVEDMASLEAIAEKTGPLTRENGHFVQKSYIISRKTLLTLSEVSRKHHISRDVLVERSVQRLLPIIEKEKENHRKRKGMIRAVEAYLENGNAILAQIKQNVGKDDPMYQAFSTIINTGGLVKAQLDDIMKRGKRMEDFDPD